MTRRGTAEPKLDRSTGRWYFRTDIGARPDGTRRQTTRRGFRTKAEAQAALDKLRVRVREGSLVSHVRQTLAEFLVDDWLPQEKSRLSASTWESYDRHLRTHVLPALGGIRLQMLDGGHLNAFYGGLLESGRRDGRGGLSARSVRYLHTIVHAALDDAVRWGRLIRNPADQADPPSAKAAKAPEMKTWAAADLLQFLDALSNDRYFAPFLFLATTGSRRGECLGLRWTDLDFDNARASIRQTVICVGDEIVFSPTTKTGKARSIDLDRETVAVLRGWRAEQAEERLALGPGYRDNGLVFCLPDGRPFHPKRFSREFSRRVSRFGLPLIRLHDLRHTWATLALQAGVPIKIVSERLGHASTLITSDIYSHVTPAMASDAAEKVAGLIFGDKH